MHRVRPALPLTTALALTLTLAGCTTPASSSLEPQAGTLTLADGWVKATDEDMTGVFGSLVNDTAEEVHLIGAESDRAARAELHVTVDDGSGGRMMMEAEDGFSVPAGAYHELEPGGDHLMLMQLTGPISTGEEVEITLVTADGLTYDVTVTARAFTGAEEHYAPGQGTDGEVQTGGDADGGMPGEGEATDTSEEP